MNTMDPNVSKMGVILTDNVDLNWLKSIEPRAHKNFIKFVVNLTTNKVCVGMDVHRNCQPDMGTSSELYGGNIFFSDGHVEYESTLNIPFNTENGTEADSVRVITNSSLIAKIDNVLNAWILL